ncbi:MAG: two-component regulator propeller domain-containing protein [Paludibacter sp.]|nr:two-component regulator propeller domain-containing protein [Paludibacter sp.]
MIRKYFLISLIFFPLLNFALDRHALSFQKFPYKELLPNSSVKRIFQDHKGYIWLGTESGICRYDGYKLHIIKSNINQPNLLTSGNILCIAEDQENRIWFGTDRGVNVIDQNNQIIPLINDKKICNLRINSIFCDTNNKVWIGSEEGLFIYNSKDNSIKSYYHTNDPMSLPGNNINHILKDRAGNIWIGMWKDGLCRFDNKHENFIAMPSFGKENNPFYIFQDSDGILWVGTWSDGLFRVNINQSIDFPEYTQFIRNNNDPSSIGQNSVYSIVQDNISGNLWILSQNGLSIISDRKNVKFENINALDIFSDASNFLNHIIEDKQGNIWIATFNDGVYLANLNKSLFYSNTLDDLKKNIGYINVFAIFQNEDEIWLGLSNMGIYVIDRHTQHVKSISKLRHQFHTFNHFEPTTIHCFCKNKSDNSVWAAGNNLLVKIYKKNNQYFIKDISDIIKKKMNKKRISVTALYCDEKKRMWVGTRQGIYLVSEKQTRLISSVFNNVHSICEEKNGTVWVGSTSKGLMKIIEENGKFYLVPYTTENKKIISNEINAIMRDKNGNIWIGTNNGGLNLYNQKSDRYIPMNKKFAIMDDDIKNILQDDHNGDLWLSTNNRIIKIDMETGSSLIFSEKDNIKISSFKTGAFCKDSDGRLYFGGGNGFCSFFPNIKKQPSIVNKTAITDIEIYNQSIFKNFDPNTFDKKTQTLYLNYRQRNIGIEFSALNFIAPSNINYAYKLKGVDENWIYVDNKRRYVNYNNLKKGKYTFQVKSTDENGVWIENTDSSLNIIVKPAPYETWWAYMLYFLTLSIISYLTYRTVINRLHLKRDLFISKIRQEKTEELTQIKLRYFTNISHELLTPLTIISCLIEDFNQDFPDKFKQYGIMRSNIIRLKRLLQQILDFRKTESGNMKLKVKEADLIDFINQNCRNNFDPLVKEKNIQFTITSPSQLIGYFDADKIDKVLFNILSNAFKHTPKNGTINLTIQPELKNDVLYVVMFISDTGDGIESKRLPYIFDRFFGSNNGESNGIGLSLTKELIEIHKGSISVESQINTGTTFVVELPIDGHIYTSEEKEIKTKDIQISPVEINEDTTDIDYINSQHQVNADISLLVVEDNPELLMIITNSLSRQYRVIKASNGNEAIKIIQGNDIDLVVSDVMMPEMDGITLCKTIKKDFEFSHTPVLLLTAKNQIEDRIDCYNAGADAYISKPFEMAVLVARIQNLIANRQKKNKEFQTSFNINPKNYEQDSVDGNFLREAIKMIEDNLDNFDFSHEQLIDSMSTSKSTFYRKIKSLTGLSPSEFVRNIRLKHACLMLKNRTGNISEVSYAVGFNDPKYFSTCFKTEFGLTPREYIKEFTTTNNDKETIETE